MAQSLPLKQKLAEDAVPRAAEPKRTIREFVNKRSGTIALAVITNALGLAAGLAPYYIAYRVVDTLFGKPLTQVDTAFVWQMALLAVVAIVIKSVGLGLSERFAHIAAYDILYHIRIALAEKMGALPLGYFTTRNIGDLKKVMHEDVEKMEEGFAHMIPSIVGGIVPPLVTAIILFLVDWRMALAVVIMLPVVLGIFMWMYRRASARFAEFSALQTKMNAAAIQYVNGMKVIKAFTLTNVSFAKLRDVIEEMAAYYRMYQDLTNTPFALLQTLIRATLITVMPLGVYLVLNGSLSVPTLALFILLGTGFNRPLFALFYVSGQAIWNVSTASKRILDVFDTPSLSEPAQPQQPRGFGIEFKDVSFSYVRDGVSGGEGDGEISPTPAFSPSSPLVLNNVSFTIPQGSVTALVGPSGAGKTTIARLIPRFWDVAHGSVTLGGVNIKNIGTEQLMDHVAFVFQDVFLFNDSIYENIRAGKPNATEAEIVAAGKAARCDEFVAHLPRGYHTHVGENGALLSGGQRQRISIARAILKDAPVVVLDEATALVDPENEGLIQDALNELLRAGKTIVIVAHRLSTITGADQIMVVDDGRIAATGTHAQLLQTSPLYQTLWHAFNDAGAWEFGIENAELKIEKGQPRVFSPSPNPQSQFENPYSMLNENDGIVTMLRKLAGPSLHGLLRRSVVIKMIEGMFIGAPTLLAVLALVELFKAQPNAALVWVLVAGMALCYLGQWIFGAATLRSLERVYTLSQRNLRVFLAEYLRRLPLGFFTRRDVGTIDALFTTNMEFLDIRTPLGLIVSAVVAPTLIFVSLLFVDWRMALATAIGLPLAFFVLIPIASKIFARTWKAQSAARTKANARIVEYIQGISVIRAFNLSGARLVNFEQAVDEYRVTSTRTMTELTPIMVSMIGVLEMGLAALVPLGVFFVLGGTLTPERLLISLVLAVAFYEPLVLLGEMLAWQRQVQNAVRNINAFLQEPMLPEAAQPRQPRGFGIAFRDVSFSYERQGDRVTRGQGDDAPSHRVPLSPSQDNRVLNTVSFTIPERSLTALVGPSGSGKTTITNLIARFWDVTRGEVTVGGVNVKDMTTDDLLRNITMVFQDVYLFNDTVLNNIKIGKPDATIDEVIEAAKQAQAHEFITAMPQGYETMVGEGGATLSGGQKQRISIARAILKDAPIVLLDEATASIDPENERLIQQAFNALAARKTLVIIAHRLNTVQRADQILVINDGKVEQRGTHAELIAQDGLYARFWHERERARSWKIKKGGVS